MLLPNTCICTTVDLHALFYCCSAFSLSLVSIDENHFAHYVFAVVGFGAIIVFTCLHSILLQTPACAAVAAIQFAACAHIVHRHGSNGDIFWGEVAFIGAFALFYLHLHCIAVVKGCCAERQSAPE